MKRTDKLLRAFFYMELVAAILTVFFVAFAGKPFSPIDSFTNEVGSLRSFAAIMAFSLLLLIAVTLIIVTTVFSVKKNRAYDTSNILIFAVFIVLSAVWIFFESGTPNMLFKNKTVVRLVSYFSFYLMPIAFMLFLRGMCVHSRRIVNYFTALLLVSFLVSLAFMLHNDLEFPKALSIFHIILGACVAVSVAVTCMEFFKYKNNSLKELLIGMCGFGVFALLDLVSFYASANGEYTLFMTLGVLFFVAMLAIGISKRAATLYSHALSFAEVSRDTPVGLCMTMTDDDYTIIYANDEFYAIFGYCDTNKAIFSGKGILHPDDLARVTAETNQYIKSGKLRFDLEARFICKDGSIKWILSRCRYNPSTTEATMAIVDITERRLMEEKLRISEEEFRFAALQSEKHIQRFDIATSTVYQKTCGKDLFAMPEVIPNMPESALSMDVVAPESRDAYESFYRSMQRGEPSGSTVVRMKRAVDGKWAWYRGDYSMAYGDEGEPKYGIASFYDITEQREKSLAYEKMRQEYSLVPPEKISTYDCNLTHDTTDNTSGKLLGAYENDHSQSFNERTAVRADSVHPADRARYTEFMNRERLLDEFMRGVNNQKMEYRRIVSGENYRWLLLTVQLVKYSDSNEIKAFVVVLDIDEEKRAELELLERSRTDMLTEVLNRGTFAEEVKRLVEHAGDDVRHALVMIDIDEFKRVNDVLGHVQGDSVLAKVAASLKSMLREGDLIGRIGGDEFMLCMRNIPHDEVIQKRAKLICDLIYSQLDTLVTVSASVGIAIYPRDGKTFEELYRNADAAMYHAKASGRNRYAFYRKELLKTYVHTERTPIDG